MVTPISDNDGKMETKDFLDACWQTICNKHKHEDQRLSPCQILLLHYYLIGKLGKSYQNYTHFFFIRTLCFCFSSSFLKFLSFEPDFFLFFFLISRVLRLKFLIFFLSFWYSDAAFF